MDSGASASVSSSSFLNILQVAVHGLVLED